MTGVIINFMCASLVDWPDEKKTRFRDREGAWQPSSQANSNNEGGRVVRELLARGSTPELKRRAHAVEPVDLRTPVLRLEPGGEFAHPPANRARVKILEPLHGLLELD